MANNHIVLLENSLTYFDLLVQNFPSKIAEDIHWHIFVDTRQHNNFRPPTKESTGTRRNLLPQLITICSDLGHPNFDLNRNVTFYDGEEIMKLTEPEGLNDQQKEFWNFHSMSMKFASQIHLFKNLGIDKFLYIDDDVIIPRDPTPLFQYEAFIQKCSMHGHVGDSEHYQQIQKIAEYQVSPEDYNKNCACAGVMLMNRNLNEKLEKSMHNFYKSDYLLKLFHWYKGRKAHYTKFFFSDQTLMNILYVALGYTEKVKDAAYLFGQKSITTPKRGDLVLMRKIPILIHYAAGPHKSTWVDYFNSEAWKKSKEQFLS